MILVLCPNLAIDVTLAVDELVLGAVHRAPSAVRRAGGKGVNVARALGALGEEPLVLGFVGGRRGDEIAERLGGEELASELVPIRGESRTCTILLERGSRATVVNEAGPVVDDSEVSALVARFEARLPRASAVAFMGSLLPGMPDNLLASLVLRAREEGVFRLVDTSGQPLARAMASTPSIVKPNRDEAEQVLGRALDSEASRYEALAEFRARGAEIAMLTLGAEGVLVQGPASADASARQVPSLSGRFWSEPSSDLRLGNPTGAGDTLAAGLLAGFVRGYRLDETVKLGVAAAVASLAEGYGRIRAKDLRPEAVRFELRSGS